MLVELVAQCCRRGEGAHGEGEGVVDLGDTEACGDPTV